jgi:hypothetical protein
MTQGNISIKHSSNKMKKTKIPHCRNSPKISNTIVERGNIDTPNAQIHDRSLSWYRHFNEKGGIKLVLWAQVSLLC